MEALFAFDTSLTIEVDVIRLLVVVLAPGVGVLTLLAVVILMVLLTALL